MSRFPLTLSFILLAANAFAVGELPVVNPEKVVSALELYGVPKKSEISKAVEMPAAKVVRRVRAAAPEPGAELLIPSRPSADLWTKNTDEAPLRMPNQSEYSVLKSDFVLPEENLEAEPQFAAQRVSGVRRVPVSKAAQPKNTIVVPPKEIEREMPPARPVERSAPSVPAIETAPSKVAPSMIRSVPRKQPRSAVPMPRAEAVHQDEEAAEEFAYNGDVPFSKLSPSQLKRAFKKTFTTENKHLSTYQIDDKFDVVSFDEAAVGFDSSRDLSEQGGIRPLEIKIGFNDEDSALSRDNYNLLTEYAGIVAGNPKRAVQISISERATRSYDGRKLAARRLAIIEQVLKDSGILDRRIIPVLSQRGDESFVLRVISSDTFQTLTEKKRDIFGDAKSGKTYRSMSW